MKTYRSSLGSMLLEFVLAGSILGVTFGVLMPQINNNIKDLCPDTMQEVSDMAAKNTFDKTSNDYFFNIQEEEDPCVTDPESCTP